MNRKKEGRTWREGRGIKLVRKEKKHLRKDANKKELNRENKEQGIELKVNSEWEKAKKIGQRKKEKERKTSKENSKWKKRRESGKKKQRKRKWSKKWRSKWEIMKKRKKKEKSIENGEKNKAMLRRERKKGKTKLK